MSIEPEFSLGQEVWFAHCGVRQVVHPCPVCCGKLKVAVILGDDTRVEVPCEYCGGGYEGPHGSVTGYEYVAKPELVRITRVDENIAPAERRYFSAHFVLDGLIFRTEDEARAKCEEIAAEHVQDMAKKFSWSRKSEQVKSYSWKAGYHLQEAKRMREQAEWHEKAARICKEAQRGGKP